MNIKTVNGKTVITLDKGESLNGLTLNNNKSTPNTCYVLMDCWSGDVITSVQFNKGTFRHILFNPEKIAKAINKKGLSYVPGNGYSLMVLGYDNEEDVIFDNNLTHYKPCIRKLNLDTGEFINEN